MMCTCDKLDETNQTKDRNRNREEDAHSALVWLLSCVSAHMNHQHVLGFERPLLSRALLPVTHKLLLFSMDVLIVDVLFQ